MTMRKICEVLLLQSGRRCSKTIAPELTHTCWTHRNLEAEFDDPFLCEGCDKPIPPSTGRPTVCSKACRYRRDHERQGRAITGPSCARCGSSKTWMTTGHNYICQICGYMSDAPERVVPGALTASARQMPEAVVVASRRASYRGELNAKPADELPEAE